MRRIAALALFALAGSASAQYKWIDTGGGVNYSDRPPAGDTTVVKRPGLAAVNLGDPSLPYPLRMAAVRYPVVLYTTNDCAPCRMAREFLSKRGIPFAEKLVSSDADYEAYKGLGLFDNQFPSISVGKQASSGFEPNAWDKLLDAANYPKTSALPSTYRLPPAEPMAGAPKAVARPGGKEGDDAAADEQVAAVQPVLVVPKRPPLRPIEPASRNPDVRF